MRRLLLLCILIAAGSLHAQTLRDEMLVSTDWLARNADRAVVIEIGDRVAFEAAHLPAARLIETSELLVQRNGTPNELPEIASLEALFTRAGAGDRGRIVLYSRDPLLAARGWFTLDYLGHGYRAAILDGGFAKWTDEERATIAGSAPVEPRPFHARVHVAAVTRIKAMKELVRYRDVLGPSLVIIDARAPDQFSTDRIPGAVNVPAPENLIAGAVPRLLPERELREVYTLAGVTARSTNVVYCRTGMQASLTYFALRYLGYDATLYDGSFVEWSQGDHHAYQTDSVLRLAWTAR